MDQNPYEVGQHAEPAPTPIPEDVSNKIHNGYMAGYIAAGLNVVVGVLHVIGSSAPTIRLVDYVASAAIIAALAFGVQRKSRVAAVLLLLYFIAASIQYMVVTGQVGGVLIPIIFMLLFYQAIHGTFEWHRLRNGYSLQSET